MKFKVAFTLYEEGGRKSPVLSCYRPNWTSSSKPEQNCASLTFDIVNMIYPGETWECFLEPFASELWTNVSSGDTLICMEGSKEVGEAFILSIKPDIKTI